MSFIKRMENELETLDTMRGNGEDFIITSAFNNLDTLDQRLLFAQLSVMESYSEILYTRILRAKELENA